MRVVQGVDVVDEMIAMIVIVVADVAVGWITSKNDDLTFSSFVLCGCYCRVTVERAKGSPRARGRGSSGGSDNGRSPRNGRDHGRSGFRSSRSGKGGDK